MVKTAISKFKGQITIREKNICSGGRGKSLYKELLQMNKKMTCRPIEKWVKDMFTEHEIQVVFIPKERSSNSNIIREMQI